MLVSYGHVCKHGQSSHTSNSGQRADLGIEPTAPGADMVLSKELDLSYVQTATDYYRDPVS